MNGCNSQEMPFWDLKNTSTVMVCISLPMDRRFVYLNPARGLAASCAPRLLANWNAIKWIYCSVHVYCDQKMKPWQFSSTILSVCVEGKLEFFVNYDEWLQQSTNSIMKLQEHLRCCGFQPFANAPYQGYYVDPATGFTAHPQSTVHVSSRVVLVTHYHA